METEGSVDTQKAAYDAVDGQEKIRERDIKMLISQYGKQMDYQQCLAAPKIDQLEKLFRSSVSQMP